MRKPRSSIVATFKRRSDDPEALSLHLHLENCNFKRGTQTTLPHCQGSKTTGCMRANIKRSPLPQLKPPAFLRKQTARRYGQEHALSHTDNAQPHTQPHAQHQFTALCAREADRRDLKHDANLTPQNLRKLRLSRDIDACTFCCSSGGGCGRV